MCLAIDNKRKSGKKTGYKLLTKDKEGNYFTGIAGYPRIKLGKLGGELVEDPNILDVDDGLFAYPTGFHIFISKESAIRVLKACFLKQRGCLHICKVIFTDEVAYGRVHWTRMGVRGFDTVVARKCAVIKELEEVKDVLQYKGKFATHRSSS